MIRPKDTKSRTRTILLAFLGIVLMGVFFYLVKQSPTVQLLKTSIPREKILLKAESYFKQLNADPAKFQRRISAGIDEELLRYAQYYKKNQGNFPGLSVGTWKTTWKDKNAGIFDEENFLPAFEITFDFSGKLIGFRIGEKNLVLPDNSTLSQDDEEDVEMEARFFLESQDIKTTSLVITNKEFKTTDHSTTYSFTLKSKKSPLPGIIDTYSFEFIGKRKQITHYQWNREVDWGKAFGLPKIPTGESVPGILLIIAWLAITGIIIVHFIRKFRKDELEFKWALRLGLAIFILEFIISILLNGANLSGLLMGGLGIFIFIGVLIIFPAMESRTREDWPEKLSVIDLLFQGKGAVQETGTAILRSFFLTGLTLCWFGVVIFTASSLDIGHLQLNQNTVKIFQGLPQALSIANWDILISLFTGFILLGFWPAFLKGKIPGRGSWFVLLMVLTFLLVGLDRFFIRPPYLGLILFLPTALIWAYSVYKWDQLTVLLSLAGVLIGSDLMLMLLELGNLFSLPGKIFITFLILFFLLGVYLVFRPQSAKDYNRYVPGYVGRIAERERFLKELEIARGVQVRFLPQKVPDFPNLEIVSLCQPAMEVGGDYYDFIRMDERYMSVLIGDVSGKGVSAAFYMTMVKGIIKTLSKKVKEPAVLLAEANDIFYENAPRNVFVTIIYGIFDLKEKTLTFASAGHNPLTAWRNRTGKVETIKPKGIALGLEYGERYRACIEEKCIPIEEKDVFVFYTDGITEAMNTDEEIFGEKRLCDVIEKNAHFSPQQLQEKMMEAVREFSGQAPQHDDFTMVVIKVR